MSPVDQALETMLVWFHGIYALFLKVFGVIEDFLYRAMKETGLPQPLHRWVIVLAAVLLIVTVLKVFGGLFRILAIVFLILVILHVVLPLFGL